MVMSSTSPAVLFAVCSAREKILALRAEGWREA